MTSKKAKSFTGRARRQKTSWKVKASDFAAGILIKVGGVGTIVAVMAVFFFLFWEAMPLFLSADVSLKSREATPWKDESPLQIGVDEYQTLGWALFSSGDLQ